MPVGRDGPAGLVGDGARAAGLILYAVAAGAESRSSATVDGAGIGQVAHGAEANGVVGDRADAAAVGDLRDKGPGSASQVQRLAVGGRDRTGIADGQRTAGDRTGLDLHRIVIGLNGAGGVVGDGGGEVGADRGLRPDGTAAPRRVLNGAVIGNDGPSAGRGAIEAHRVRACADGEAAAGRDRQSIGADQIDPCCRIRRDVEIGQGNLLWARKAKAFYRSLVIGDAAAQAPRGRE